jgi:hypothetical protein
LRSSPATLEEVGPLVLAGHVFAEAAAERLLEIELGGDDEEPLRPGIALELDVEALRTVLRPPSAPMT